MPEIQANIQAGRYEDVLAAVQSPVIALTELVKNASDSCLNKHDPIIININTENRVITITDFGEGLSKDELEHLGEAGYSSKMVGDKIHSPIDNPFSGSKGLGLLTAFFIADTLEIETYSILDRRSYYLVWKKGEQKYTYVEAKSEFKGTIVTLKNIEPAKLQMILLPEEKIKLFMASIRFFTGNENLPRINLVIDEMEESHYPAETLESYYNRNKRANSGFIAKASFSYEDNQITLSYEDNISNFYTFNGKSIDLRDKRTVDRFVSDIRAPESGVAPIKSVCESKAFNEQYLPIELPAFSGVLYTWRHRKNDDLEQWPVGVRIYINNYSLYRYLDKENDWLTLSEVSQNVKATNSKLKNTYGYLDITNYNEHNEELKISKERNDFVDSMAQRKFIHIMRDIIVGIFARIDIAVKNPPIQSVSLRDSNVTVKVGETFNLEKAVICDNIGLDDIDLDFDESQISISDDWIVSADRAGSYEIKLNLDDKSHTLTIHYKNVIPEFDLQKSTTTIYKGNSVNLRDFIAISSCKDVTPDSIIILSQNKNTVIRNDVFDRNNSVGQHIVLYRYEEFQRTLSITVKEIEHQPGSGAKSPRIDILFPKLDDLRAHSFKLPELVDAISSHYVQAPTLCMAAIRILIESSAKEFFEHLVDEEMTEKFPNLVNKVMNIRACHPNSPDYKKYISVQDPEFIAKFQCISTEYQLPLSKDVKTNINAHLKEISLDMFVHNPAVVATDTTVYRSMQIFAPLLNYIFEILLVDIPENHNED